MSALVVNHPICGKGVHHLRYPSTNWELPKGQQPDQ